MNISAPFIKKPVGTSLLTVAIALAGILGYRLLPVAPLPQVEFPTIQVSASLPGASPETMASAVATPLERQFGRIAGVTEMTSGSALGSTNVTLQFELNRDIDAAARDVQAAINAARGQLPPNLPSNPRYRKVNPADAPIMILSMSSDSITLPKMYDAADSILAQKLSQVEGVGQVFVGGGAQPAVRVEVDPNTLNKYGIGLDVVRTALNNANANQAKGQLSEGDHSWVLSTTDQISRAYQYQRLILTYQNGAPVRLRDVADVQDSVLDNRNAGITNGERAVLLIISRQPNANIIETVDGIRDLLPQLRASISPAINLSISMDRTGTIRASVEDVQRTLLISIVLVVMVVFIFLRNLWATVIPSVAVPISLLGTFGIMYLLGYSLDNLSLMALTISTGFVVDDAIVVIENITRYLEEGMRPMQAALRGASEIGFTVVTMSVSLVAVFIPLLLMGGIVGRLFREFAVTLAVAIGVSLLVSLTTTPMMCAKFLRSQHNRKHSKAYMLGERVFDDMLHVYQRTLAIALKHSPITLLVAIGMVALNVYLFIIVPKGFFPQQDTGRIMGGVQAAQDMSFQAMQTKLAQFVRIVKSDPAVDTVTGFTGGQGSTNSARMFIQLKPLGERGVSADDIVNRLRGKLAKVPGATLFMQAAQDIRVGGRRSNSQYQYSLQGDKLAELDEWAPKLKEKLRSLPELRDVDTDEQNQGLQLSLQVDRDTASRFGVSPQAVDDTLYDAFGQRQVSTIYNPLNQYHVVMEVMPQYQRDPEALKMLYVRSTTGNLLPLSTFAEFKPTNTTLSVNHQGVFPATTLSFNLAPGVALGDAVNVIKSAETAIGMPSSIHGAFSGTAQAFQDSLKSEPYLVLAALVSVYIVLGMLYESYIHPITILSTLPSAGVGAILALLICGVELSVIALIGIILLIGLVKKNAILMIDFALDAERRQGLAPRDAIYQACVLRFRPIMMTTMAALLGGLPLALGTGTGSELRRPLGITIVGGLIVSQMLTLYTTPVIYLYLDRLQAWVSRMRNSRRREAPRPIEA